MIKARNLASLLLKNLPKSSSLPLSHVSRVHKASSYFNFLNFSTTSKPNNIPSQDQFLQESSSLSTENRNSLDVQAQNEETDKGPILTSKREYSKYNSLYGYVMKRVIETCLIYSRGTAEELNSIEKTSRFYYIKERMEKLSPEEQEAFFKFVNQFDEFALVRVVDKKQDERFYESVDGIPPKVVIKEQYKKANVARFIHMDSQSGPILAELILSFLNKENNDFKIFIDDHQEEFQIGVVKPAPIKAWRKNEKLEENLKDFKRKYIKLFKEIEQIILKDHTPRPKKKAKRDESEADKKEEDELPRQKMVRKFDVFRLILFRVFQSCNIYLSSPVEKRNEIDENSRFYYIHEELRSWSNEDLNKLWMYLDDLKNVSDAIIAGKTYDPQGFDTKQISFKGENPIKTKRLGSCNNTELFYIINHKQFGETLKKLLGDFLKDGNRDLYYYLSGSVNEYEIGKLVTKISRSNISTRQYLGDNIEQVRDQLKKFLENTDPMKFSRKHHFGKSKVTF